MKCSYCIQEALFKCGCQQPFMCSIHLGEHLSTLRRHDYEDLDIDLGESRLNQLRLDIFKRIKKIDNAEILITSTTKLLIKTIKNEHKKAIGKLNSLRENYFEILKYNKFCDSMLPVVEKIGKMELDIKTIDVDQIHIKIEKVYGVELADYIEKSKYMKIKFFNQHSGGFSCGAVTMDGSTFATGGFDCSIRVWDAFNKIQKFVFFGHNSFITCLTFTGNSKQIISGSNDASVRVWGLREKNQIVLFKGHKNSISAVCHVEINSQIISGDVDGEIIIWDLKKRDIHKKFKHSAGIYNLTLLKNQIYLIVGSCPDILFYELHTGNILNTLKGHTCRAWTISLTSDERKLVSGSWDNTIIIWDLISFQKISQLEGQCYYIFSLALTLDDQFIISGSLDKTIVIWNMQSGKRINIFFEQGSPIISILRVKDKFLSLSYDSSIGQLDFTSKIIVMNKLFDCFEILNFNFQNDLGLVTYGKNNKAMVWDMKTESKKYSLYGHEANIVFVEISKDGQFAISGSESLDKNLIYWDLKTGQKVTELKGHTNDVTCCSFSKNGLNAASGSTDLTTRIWNLKELRQEYQFPKHASYPSSIKFLDSLDLLVIVENDGKINIWDLVNKTNHRSITMIFTAPINKIFATDDEKFIFFCALENNYITIYNVDQLKEILTLNYQDEAETWFKDHKFELESVRYFIKA